MIHHVDGESEVYLDDALSPISVATWIGPATLKLIDKFHAWVDEQAAVAKREGRPVLLVNDGTAAGRPSAEVRRAFAEHQFDDGTEFHTFVVVTNPLVRGAMTAIGWLVGDAFDIVSCPTMSEALQRAAEVARSHDLVTPPAGELARYAMRSQARSA